MTGWNLPPGCNVSDLSGNEPEDPVSEALASLLYEKLDTKIPEDVIENLHVEIMKMVEEDRANSYSQGGADASLADHYMMEEALIELSQKGYVTCKNGKWVTKGGTNE